jgi:hypothetical protein
MFTRLQKIKLHKLRLQEFKPYLAVDMKLTMTVFHNYTHGHSCMVELIPFHKLQLISIVASTNSHPTEENILTCKNQRIWMHE